MEILSHGISSVMLSFPLAYQLCKNIFVLALVVYLTYFLISQENEVFAQSTVSRSDLVATMTIDKDGVLTIDTSGGRVLLPLLKGSNKYENLKEFAEFIQKTFGGTPVVDKKTNSLVGINIAVVVKGFLFQSTELKVEILNPIEEMLGGESGRIYVTGKEYCLNPEKCTIKEASSLRDSLNYQRTRYEKLSSNQSLLVKTSHAPHRGNRCGSGGSNCVSGESLYTDFGFYEKIGGRSRTYGNFQLAVAAWICNPQNHLYAYWTQSFCRRYSDTSDLPNLSLEVTIFADDGYGLHSLTPFQARCRDCPSLNIHLVSFFGVDQCGYECSWRGVVSRHSSSWSSGATWITSKGLH